MSEREIELEMQELLLRIVPGLAEQWRGSSPGQIEQIERIAGRPLPSFYRWFLAHMGNSMGPLTYPTLDFSAQRVLSCYEQKLVVPDSRFLLIAHEADEIMPLHLFYDFDMSTREDALVTMRDAEGGELYDKFETLYEMLAWGAVLEFRIFRMPQQCGGVVVGDCPEFLSRLDPVMESLGFAEPLSTGSLCRLYERSDAAMICNRAPRVGLGDRRAFMLGGSSAGSLRRILGEIATQPSLEVRVGEWTPKLQ